MCLIKQPIFILNKVSVVSFENVDVLQDENVVLSGVHFNLAPAETCYIIGKSGSGKTSFLKTIYGSLPIRTGKASVAGFHLHNLEEKNIPMLRRKIGMVFQDFILFDDWSVGKNLMYILEATSWKDRTKMHSRVLRYRSVR